jgi:hypothetical protein
MAPFLSRTESTQHRSSMASRCSCQSPSVSRPGITGAGELRPWRMAFQRATSLPSGV